MSASTGKSQLKYALLENPRFRRLSVVCLFVIAIIGAVTTFRELIAALDPDVSFRRDFFQEYLLGLAALKGLNPYLPLDLLANKFTQIKSLEVFPHASPHPPGVILILLPVAYLPYYSVQLIWAILQLLALSLICLLLKREFSWSLRLTALFALLLIASRSGYFELVQGQLGLLLSFFLTLALVSLKREKNIAAGICLGAAISIKLFGAPVLLYLILKRQWLSVLSALLAFLAVQASVVAILGFDPIAMYYLEVLPSISKLYEHDLYNLSFSVLPLKLVEGVRLGVGHPLSIAALLPSVIFYYLCLALVVFAAALSFLTSLRLKPLDAWLLLLAAQLLFSPIIWIHGYVLLIALGPWFYRNRFPNSALFLCVVGICVFIGDGLTSYVGVSSYKVLVPYLPTFALFAYLIYFSKLCLFDNSLDSGMKPEKIG